MKTVAILAALLLSASPAHGEDPPDMVDYISQIRSLGMSEYARAYLYDVSGLRLGHTILEYQRDDQSGRYWPRYTSTTCPVPGADPNATAKWQAELTAARDADLVLLRPLADEDGSGFVTTDEGRTFRRIIEFGYLADQLAVRGVVSLDALATAAGTTHTEAESQLIEYLALLDGLKADSLLGFPSVVIGE